MTFQWAGVELGDPLFLGDGRGDLARPLRRIGQEAFVVDIDQAVPNCF